MVSAPSTSLDQAVWLSGCGLAMATAAGALRRVGAGVPFRTLWNSRFYEVIAARAAILIVGITAAAAAAVNGAKTLGVAWDLAFGDPTTATAGQLLARIAMTVAAATLAWGWKKLLVDIPNLEAPSVAVDHVRIRAGIPPEALAEMGLLRFPNQTHRDWAVDRKLRWAINTFFALLAASALAVSIAEPWGLTLSGASAMGRWVRDSGRAIPQGVALWLAVASATLAVALLVSNRDYLLIPFRRTLAVYAGLAVAGALSSTWAAGSPDVFWTAAVGFGFALCLRMAVDLHRFNDFQRREEAGEAIVAAFGGHVRFLEQLRTIAAFALDQPDRVALSQRISRGLKNLEEKGLFVVRHAAHFMRLAEVEHLPFYALSMRFLTVNRYVTLGCGVATWERFRSPEVPVWDLDLFPLAPPRGYRERHDAEGLDSPWDVVDTCGGCGGSGVVWETVYYTETESYQDSDGRSQTRSVTRSRQELRTCGDCSGSGRLKHQQILNTEWNLLTVLRTDPATPVPDLMERAEERVFLEAPLVEAFREVEKQSLTVSSCAVPSGMNACADLARQNRRVHRELVGHAVPGRLYRSDFRVCGFHTVRIRFEGLGSGAGWFYGKRPEIHFPKLPISPLAIFTAACVPPLLVAGLRLALSL